MTTCAHCGGAQRGYGMADTSPLCHIDDPRQDCYRLVTVYGHPAPCQPCTDARQYDDAQPHDAYAQSNEPPNGGPAHGAVTERTA
jgi:hypothetical protein